MASSTIHTHLPDLFEPRHALPLPKRSRPCSTRRLSHYTPCLTNTGHPPSHNPDPRITGNLSETPPGNQSSLVGLRVLTSRQVAFIDSASNTTVYTNNPSEIHTKSRIHLIDRSKRPDHKIWSIVGIPHRPPSSPSHLRQIACDYM